MPNAKQLKMLAGYAGQSGLFFLKRTFARQPAQINTIILDVDYTLLNTLTAYRALEKMLGPEAAKVAYHEQKVRVKAGKANFADVKNWGHELQMKHGWTARDWKEVVDRAYDESLFNMALVNAMQQIQRINPGIKVVLATGTSDTMGRRLAAHLRARFGVRVDAVLGSKQVFENRGRTGKVVGLGYFMGETHSTIPAVEKLPAIRDHFKKKGWAFDPKTTMAVSDADPQLLRKCGIGVLIPASRSEDPASFVSQKFKLRDVEFGRMENPQRLVDLVLNPRGKPLSSTPRPRRFARRAPPRGVHISRSRRPRNR